MTTAPGPASPKGQGFYPSPSRRLGAHLLLLRGQHRGHGGHGLDRRRAGSFNEDGTFHSITDAVLIQHFGRGRGGHSGMGSVGYIRGNGADVTAF